MPKRLTINNYDLRFSNCIDRIDHSLDLLHIIAEETIGLYVVQFTREIALANVEYLFKQSPVQFQMPNCQSYDLVLGRGRCYAMQQKDGPKYVAMRGRETGVEDIPAGAIGVALLQHGTSAGHLVGRAGGRSKQLAGSAWQSAAAPQRCTVTQVERSSEQVCSSAPSQRI